MSCVIAVDPQQVYDFTAEPDNFPKWAEGLAKSEVRRDGDELLVDSPMGQVRVRFLPRNHLGVLDHDVTLPSGTTVANPMRVFSHRDGAEVVFTVRKIELTDTEFDRDCQMVAADLAPLKKLLEEAA